jgi:hypothetical protein
MRGQIIIEFLIVVCLAAFVGIVYLNVGNTLLRDTSEEQRLAALNNVGYTLQDELILATTVEDGYRRAITIPEKADRFSYTLSNDDSTVTLVSGSVRLNYDIPPINGTFHKGSNIIAKNGDIQVN